MSVRWSPFAKGAVIIGLLLLGVWLLDRFSALLAPLITTVIVAYLLNLPVGLLTRRTGLSRTLATAIVFLVVILLLVLVPAVIGPRLVSQAIALEFDLQAVQQRVEQFAAEPIEFWALRLDPQNLLDQVLATLGNLLSPAAASAFTLVANAAEALGWLAFVLIVAFLLVKDVHYFTRSIGELIPASLAPDAYRLGRELGDIWNAFLRGRVILSTAVGIVAILVLALLGMHNALTLGVITGILTFIPTVGPFLAGFLATLLALVRGSSYLPVSNLIFALMVAGTYVIIFQIEGLYFSPLIVGRRVRLHPVVVIIGTLGGALTAGILGVFLAAPVIASARVLLNYTYRKLLDQAPFDQPHETPQTIGVQWRGLIRGRPVEAVLFDLDGTLIETDDRMVERLAHRLEKVERFLPGRDPVRLARRLVLWSDTWIQQLLALLDWLGLDAAVQRLARRLRLIEDHSDGREMVPVAGTVALLRQLNGRYRLGIVSTRQEAEIRSYLEQHGLDGQIQVIVGSDTTERIKPHPLPVLWATDRLDVAPEQTALVGDTAADIRAAKAAGALAIGVLCGFGERDDLAQADLILESTADLAEWL